MRILIYLIIFTLALNATTIDELLDCLSTQPQIKIDKIKEHLAQKKYKEIQDSFYPVLNIFAKYEQYNSPTNLRPVPPTELASLKNLPYPFAKTIQKIGTDMNIPLFVKELFTLSKKSKIVIKNAKSTKRLHLLQNEALLVGLDANWLYLDSLKKAIEARKVSLKKVYEDLKLKVSIGKAAPIALNKIDEFMNSLDIALNNLNIKRENIKYQIESLTSKKLIKPVSLSQIKEIEKGELFVLKPLIYQLQAAKYDIQASYDKFYPKVTLQAFWSENYSQKDVKLGKDVHRGYGGILFTVTMPIFDKKNYTKIEESKLLYQKNRYILNQKKLEFIAQAKTLYKSLKLLQEAKRLAQKSHKNQKELLKYAKVAFNVGKISEEEYLRYEEKLLESESRIYEIEAKYWQNLAKLAVLYGQDLKDIVK